MPHFEESEFLELKSSTSELKQAVISISAMLNKHGKGEVLFDVKNDGAVVGQALSAKTLRDISKTISDHIRPPVFPQVEKVLIEGRFCIRVAFSGLEKPYLAYGRAYIRVADEDRQLSPAELENLILQQHQYRSYWDSQPSAKTVADINLATFDRFIRKGEEAGRLTLFPHRPSVALAKMQLANESILTNAAQILFCDNNSLQVQAAVFAGKEKLTFLDIRSVEGNLYDLLEKCEAYIKEKINWRVKFGKLERQEIPEIPLAAVREALVNSLCHRDYTNPKGNEIAVFKDRIEIYNPGSFPEGLTPEDYIRGSERSYLRNPLIAEVLYKSKDIEKWGSGIKRISDECAQHDVKVIFTVLKTGFLVTFFRPDPNLETEKESHAQKKDRAKPGSRVGEKVGERLTANQKRILMLLQADNSLSAKDIASQIGISARKTEENIAKLKLRGMVRRIGPARGGYWQVLGNWE